MHQGQLVFSQLMCHLPLTTFRRCVARYAGEHKVKSFSCLDQYLCMAFAQLTYRESLRDIESSLRAQAAKLYHPGIRGNVSRNTLANANATRDWRIYANFAERLIDIARLVCRGTLRRGLGRDGLRPRRDDDRFVFVGLPVGAVPIDEGGRQAAHRPWLLLVRIRSVPSDHGICLLFVILMQPERIASGVLPQVQGILEVDWFSGILRRSWRRPRSCHWQLCIGSGRHGRHYPWQQANQRVTTAMAAN